MHAHTLTHLAEIEVTVVNSVYNISEQSTVRICASHTGHIQRAIYLVPNITPGTADGKHNSNILIITHSHTSICTHKVTDALYKLSCTSVAYTHICVCGLWSYYMLFCTHIHTLLFF
jgi:hypothetical protein